MKKQLLYSLWFLLGVSSALPAQDTKFYIFAVKGKILNQRTHQYLQSKQTIQATDQVVFESKEAKALLYQVDKGRFALKLSPQKQQDFKAKPLLVTQNISPEKKRIRLRGIIMDFRSLAKHLVAHNPYVILGNSLKLCVPTMFVEQMKREGEGLFFIRYQYEGKTRNIALSFKNKCLLITKKALFQTKEGTWLNPAKVKGMYLAYYKKATQEVLHLGTDRGKLTFHPLFLSTKDLKASGIWALATFMHQKKVDKDRRLDELIGALSTFGQADISNVSRWCQKNFK